MQMNRAARILRKTHWRAIESDAVLVDEFIKIGVGAWKADQLPADHVLIAAINGIVLEEIHDGIGILF